MLQVCHKLASKKEKDRGGPLVLFKILLTTVYIQYPPAPASEVQQSGQEPCTLQSGPTAPGTHLTQTPLFHITDCIPMLQTISAAALHNGLAHELNMSLLTAH